MKIRFLNKRLFLIIFAIVILAWRYISLLPASDEKYVGSYVGQSLVLRGYAVGQADFFEGYSAVPIKIESFEMFGKSYPMEGVVVARNAAGFFDRGDEVAVSGTLEAPLRKDPRIAASINKPDFRILKKNKARGFSGALLRLKSFLIGRLNLIFTYPESSFAAGLLFGARSSIPRDVISDFRQSGLTHILALSGFNISILIGFIAVLFSGFLPRKGFAFFAILLVVTFIIMVSPTASVVRAGIMGSLDLVAKGFGRRSAGLRALLATAYVMLLIDPFLAFYDVGFQLSFAATAGILVFSNRLKKYLEKIPNWLGITDSLVVTLSAQIFTLPFLIYHFRGFSIVAPVANFVVLPAIPLLMLGSFIAMAASFISLNIGLIIAAPFFILFKTVLAVIHALGSFSFSFWAF